MVYVYVFVLLGDEQADPSVIDQDAMRESLTLAASQFHPDRVGLLSHKATTIAIASTVRKANAKSSFRCDGLLILIVNGLRGRTDDYLKVNASAPQE